MATFHSREVALHLSTTMQKPTRTATRVMDQINSSTDVLQVFNIDRSRSTEAGRVSSISCDTEDTHSGLDSGGKGVPKPDDFFVAP